MWNNSRIIKQKMNLSDFMKRRYAQIDKIIELDKKLHKANLEIEQVKKKHSYYCLKKSKNIANAKISSINRQEYEYVRKKGLV